MQRLQFHGLALAGLLVTGALCASSPAMAQAAVMKECGDEWQAAKAANTVKAGQTWNQFLAECRTRKASAPAAVPAQAANPARPAAARSGAGIVFPKAVDPKYSTLSAGRARQKTCSDQWQANKERGGNGTLKWIEKSGGYWSLCNKALKGES